MTQKGAFNSFISAFPYDFKPRKFGVSCFCANAPRPSAKFFEIYHILYGVWVSSNGSRRKLETSVSTHKAYLEPIVRALWFLPCTVLEYSRGIAPPLGSRTIVWRYLAKEGRK